MPIVYASFEETRPKTLWDGEELWTAWLLGQPMPDAVTLPDEAQPSNPLFTSRWVLPLSDEMPDHLSIA